MIELKNLSVSFGEKRALSNLSLTIKKGELLSIIGPNGCGKTTLLKAAAKLIPVSSGELFLFGKPYPDYSPKEFAKKVAVLPQIRTAPNMSVGAFVSHGRFPYLGFSRRMTDEDKNFVEHAMKITGVYEMRHQNLLSLSGGERQKVYLAMTVAQDAEIVFLDEPTTFLDINHRLEILNLLRSLSDIGKTIVFVHHELSEALSFSECVVLMESGQIRSEGSPDELFSSGEIERVFHVNCHRFMLPTEKVPRYFFEK